jgi:hypothetical protein
MACVLCASNNEVEFPAEMILHFPFSGLQDLNKNGVFIYPKVLVCLDCGFSRFTTRETEVAALAKGVGRQMKPGNRGAFPTAGENNSEAPRNA